MLKDTSHPNFNIPAKKKRKSKWCNGFILLPPTSDIERIEWESMDRIRNAIHKNIKGRT